MVQQVGRPKTSWWQVLRVLVVLGWVAWAGLTWWMNPRESDAAHARSDIAAGRLSYYEWGNGWRNDGGLVRPFPAGLERSAGLGPMLLWYTTDGRRHYATIAEPAAEAGALDQELNAYESRRPTDPPTGAVQTGLLIAGSVLFLWALVSAADPVTGTKWFWFWLVTGVPLGLGLLWWLARERPWSSRAPVREKRLNGWTGFGLGLLGALVVSLAVWGLHRLLGDGLVPVPR